MEDSKDLLMIEFSNLKEQSEKSKEQFISKLKENYEQILISQEDMRKQISSLETTLSITNAKSASNYNYIQELQKRSAQFATNIEKCQKELQLLYELKQDKILTEQMRNNMQLAIEKMQKELDEKTNQFNNVENFVEKYIPIRIQSQISETLAAILNRSQLNKLENFEMEKFQILNQVILDDDGSANLESIMREVLKEIIKEKEEEDAKKQKKSYILINGDSQSSIKEDKSMKQKYSEKSLSRNDKITINQNSVSTLNNQIIQEINDDISEGGFSNDCENEKKLDILKISQQNTSETEEPSARVREKDKQNMFDLLVKLDLSKEVSIKQLLQLPYEIDDEDQDLALSPQGFLKILKIFMYKLGLTYKRQEYFKNDVLDQMQEKYEKYKQQTQQTIKEINEFLQGFQQDFEQFSQLNKRERQDIKNQIHALYENVKEVNQQLMIHKATLDKYSTILSCQTEFMNVENTLDLQYDIERKIIEEQFKQTYQQLKKVSDYVKEELKPRYQKISLKKSQFKLEDQNSNQESIQNQSINDFQMTLLEIPSSIEYRQYALRKDQIFQMRQILLEKIQEIMKKSSFFRYLQPAKIFTDMYQCYQNKEKEINERLIQNSLNAIQQDVQQVNQTTQSFQEDHGDFNGFLVTKISLENQNMTTQSPSERKQNAMASLSIINDRYRNKAKLSQIQRGKSMQNKEIDCTQNEMRSRNNLVNQSTIIGRQSDKPKLNLGIFPSNYKIKKQNESLFPEIYLKSEI